MVTSVPWQLDRPPHRCGTLTHLALDRGLPPAAVGRGSRRRLLAGSWWCQWPDPLLLTAVLGHPCRGAADWGRLLGYDLLAVVVVAVVGGVLPGSPSPAFTGFAPGANWFLHPAVLHAPPSTNQGSPDRPGGVRPGSSARQHHRRGWCAGTTPRPNATDSRPTWSATLSSAEMRGASASRPAASARAGSGGSGMEHRHGCRPARAPATSRSPRSDLPPETSTRSCPLRRRDSLSLFGYGAPVVRRGPASCSGALAGTGRRALGGPHAWPRKRRTRNGVDRGLTGSAPHC